MAGYMACPAMYRLQHTRIHAVDVEYELCARPVWPPGHTGLVMPYPYITLIMP